MTALRKQTHATLSGARNVKRESVRRSGREISFRDCMKHIRYLDVVEVQTVDVLSARKHNELIFMLFSKNVVT